MGSTSRLPLTLQKYASEVQKNRHRPQLIFASGRKSLSFSPQRSSTLPSRTCSSSQAEEAPLISHSPTPPSTAQQVPETQTATRPGDSEVGVLGHQLELRKRMRPMQVHAHGALLKRAIRSAQEGRLYSQPNDMGVVPTRPAGGPSDGRKKPNQTLNQMLFAPDGSKPIGRSLSLLKPPTGEPCQSSFQADLLFDLLGVAIGEIHASPTHLDQAHVSAFATCRWGVEHQHEPMHGIGVPERSCKCHIDIDSFQASTPPTRNPPTSTKRPHPSPSIRMKRKRPNHHLPTPHVLRPLPTSVLRPRL